ncbi:hypothetical protein RHMOL_Rhmol01G0173200 [Rhododendron molle]|uniref:Uncharacterized protein n=1 Tax=Rhododendron molle TaxID=49168 RepID=A0ACC0Q5G4_RHOML|nr:hypothetical protein RHMOL_Rhmol01G0173200 [Rhododendron molle]
MCPTMEEFQAYLQGFIDTHSLAIPPFQEDMDQLLRTTLNIPKELSASVIQGDELNIARLIELYGPEGALGDYVGQAHRRLVLSICPLAAYILIPADERAVSSFLLVFTLVQLWLSDKVGMLDEPQPVFEHVPRNLVERPMLYPELLMVEWYAFLNDMQSEDIVWRCPWLNPQEMSVNSARFERIAGLTSFTFSFPGHILDQLGISQRNKHFGREHFELPDFNARNLHIYRCSWNDRELEGPLLDSITWLESCYVKWLHKEVKARSGGNF